MRLDLYQAACQIWIRNARWLCEGKVVPLSIKPGPGGLVEQVAGQTRVTVFGPEPILVQAPADVSQPELVLEFRVVYNQVAMGEVVTALRSQLELMRRSPSRPHEFRPR